MFDDHVTKNRFRAEFNTFATGFGVTPKTSQVAKKVFYGQVVTKSKRQKILDRFFRVVFKQVSQSSRYSVFKY